MAFIFVLLAALGIALPASAESNPEAPAPTLAWLQQETLLDDGVITPAGGILVAKPLTAHVGMFGSAFVSRPYAEAYAGPFILFGPFSFGIGAGLEQWEKGYRVGAMANLFLKKFWMMSTFEYGGSGPWGRIIAAGDVLPWLSIGGMAQVLQGAGPYVQVMPYPTKQTAALFGSWMMGRENRDSAAFFGIRIYM